MYLGIDLGTSGLKVVLLEENGSLLDQASISLDVKQPRFNWSEQNPEDWWQALIEACRKLSMQHDLNAIKSIGLSGQMHGATLIDKRGGIIRPCMLWNDGRSVEQCRQLEAKVVEFRVRSGNLAMPGFTAPKVLWVKQHELENFEKIHQVLLPKDYLRYRLTGVFATDLSDAAGTCWLNPELREWDEILVRASGLKLSQLPGLYEGPDITGEISNEARVATGLPQVSVVAGASDNAGGALGVGLTKPGQSMLSLGTSGVIFTVSGNHCAAPEQTVHAFCHALPELWHQMTVSLCAGGSLSWLGKMLNQNSGDLLHAVSASGRAETEVIFLPYLSGERTPHNNPDAVGQFYGLTLHTDAVDLTLAVLEGVAFSQADGLQALRLAGVNPTDMNLIGGGSRSVFWQQLLADTLGLNILKRDGGDVGPALGAARLAQFSQGRDSLEQVFTQPEIMQICEPCTARFDYLQSQCDRYRKLYRLTKQLEL